MKLDLDHYLDATTQATRRARGTILVLVIASVLVFASLLNSLKNEWARQRLITISNDPYDFYVSNIVGYLDHSIDGNKEREKRYQALYQAAARDYVDIAWVVHVPLFGFAFDVNDLGLVGAAGFIVLLSMLLFSLKRELSNLKTAFDEAKRQDQLRVFYDLLAMEQVLTVPEALHMRRSWFLRVVPKMILCIPAAVYLCVVGHDVKTFDVGHQINDVHTWVLYGCELVLGILILWLTGSVVKVVKEVDDTWNSFFVKPERDGTSQVEPN